MIILLVFLGAISATSVLALNKDAALSKFLSGNLLYKDGDFKEAIAEYESILASGKASGSVHFNLANAYYRLKQTGKSVLHYERAKQFIPRDSDVKFNVDYLRRNNGIAQREDLGLVDKLIQGHINFYTINEMLLIVSLCLMIAGVIFLLAFYLRWPNAKRNASMGVLICVAVIFIGGLFLKINHDADRAIVLLNSAAYFEPRAESTIHFDLREGEGVQIVADHEEWIKVKRLDGKLGWIAREAAEKI